jgi:hypothetical protein
MPAAHIWAVTHGQRGFAPHLLDRPARRIRIERVATDDFGYHLGLREGAIPQTANAYSLETWDGYAAAITVKGGS